MKVKMKNFLIILLIIFCLPAFTFVNFVFAEEEVSEASSEELSDAKAAYEKAQADYNNGPITFLNERMVDSKYYLENQEKLLAASSDSTVKSAYAKYGSQFHSEFTYDSLRKEATWLKELNDRRATDDNFTEERNHAALKLSPELISVSMVSTMISSSNYYHALFVTSDSSLINLGYAENLAWGYEDPLVGWYDEEKKVYDSNQSGETAHYTMCMKNWPSTAVVGFGMVGTCTALRFDFKPVGNSYTADEWLQAVNDYEASLQAKVDTAREKYQTLQKETEGTDSKKDNFGLDDKNSTDKNNSGENNNGTDSSGTDSSDTESTKPTIGWIYLSATRYPYNGSVRKPSVKVYGSDGKPITSGYSVSYSNNCKNIGAVTVTVTGNEGCTGRASATFIIAPAKVKKPSLRAKKRKLVIKWKNPGGGSQRYQIAIKRTGKKYHYKYYTTSSTSKTVKHLKRHKKYTVKVRSYVKINGKTYYGSWSSLTKKRVK